MYTYKKKYHVKQAMNIFDNDSNDFNNIWLCIAILTL